MGIKCWGCYRISKTEAQVKNRSTPEGRAKASTASCAWAKKYPEKASAIYHKRRDKKRGNTEQLSPEDQALTDRTIAEIRSYGLTVDHMIPVAEYGEHAHWNLNALSQSLNSAKSNRLLFSKSPLSWLEMRQQELPIETYELIIKDLL